MAKSRAEIQRDYRERQKKTRGKDFLRKEAKRVKSYYVPTKELSKKKLLKRRDKIRKSMEKKRQRDRQASKIRTEHDCNDKSIDSAVAQSETIDIAYENGPCDSTTPTVVPSTSTEGATANRPLTIKMNFPAPRKGRKRKPEVVKKMELRVRQLSEALNSARRKNDALRKRLSRIDIHRVESSNKSGESSKEILSTPRSRTKRLMRLSGISPRQHKTISRKLQLHESMIDDMTSTEHAANVAGSKSVKRSRSLSAASEALKLNRHKVARKARGPTCMQRRKMVETARVKATVISFMERDDNSTCLPGKSDCVKTSVGMEQKRFLSDLLCNLHEKFRSEHPDIKINLSTFGSYRPKRIKLVHYSSRRTCLCQRHQNMALKVKALLSLKITNDKTPYSYIKRNSDQMLLTNIEQSKHDTVMYTEWQRVETEYKGRTTKRMTLVKISKTKNEFIEIMRKDLCNFRNHCKRVKIQYEEIRKLTDDLPFNHAIIQMDFSENYICSHADEVQSAYFDKATVTLHPTVIYYKNPEGKLDHNSYVIVSDTTMHNSGTVLAFIREIVPIVRELVPALKTVHYVTDSPTSQYRNKHMFYTVANHHKMFDSITASWQYFEAGHGKGPCDGVGGTAKRQADSAVKRQICSIQNADDFYTWAKFQTQSHVKYIFVPDQKCCNASEYLKGLNIKPVKGTMTVHSCVSLGNSCIAVRDTSCFCNTCFENGEFKASCSGWNRHTFVDEPLERSVESSVRQSHASSRAEKNNDLAEEAHTSADETVGQQYPKKSYVAAVYDGQWYVGSVEEYDPEDNTYQISFMTKASGLRGPTFKWPLREDVCWRTHADIICGVDEPILYGKTRRLYKLSAEDFERVQNSFNC